MATALFMEYIIEMTDASTDAEHIEMIIHNCPQIPDRTSYILGRSQLSPAPKMIEIGKALEACGCELIAVPCITANYFYQEISNSLGVQLLDGVEETAAAINSYNSANPHCTVSRVGVMATDGTIESKLFQNAMSKYNINCIIPDPEHQRKVMSLIYDDVKGGHCIDTEVINKFIKVKDYLFEEGAELVVLGCTELSVIGRSLQESSQLPNAQESVSGLADALRALAQSSVLKCGKLKPEFENIINPIVKS